MVLNLTVELVIFAAFLGFGICVGIVKDVITMRWAKNKDKMFEAIFDLTYSYLFALVLFAVSYNFNSATYRLYPIVASVIGILIYSILLSGVVKALIGFALRLGTKIIEIIFKILLTPILFLYKIMLCFKKKENSN